MPSRMILTLAVVAAAIAASGVAWPQQQADSQQVSQQNLAPSDVPPPQIAPPPARSNPGFIEELGKMLKNSASSLRGAATGLTARLPSTQDTLDGLNSTTKGAADNLAKITPPLPSAQSVVSGRAICPPAPNGAPDCKMASDQLCKDKGYKQGRSVDIETANKCSAQAYFSGTGACHTENFVTRAVCQ